MTSLFKNHHPFTVLLLLIMTILVNLQLMLHPEIPIAAPDQLAYEWLLSGLRLLLGSHAVAYSLFAVFMLFTQALYLNHIAVQYRLFSKATYLPAFCFLLVTALAPGMGGCSPQLFANWALIGALQAGCSLNGAASPRKQIFNLGFLVALTALSLPANLLLFGCLAAAMVIMRSFKSSEWVVALLGYLTPFYFFAGVLFLLDKLDQVDDWRYFSFHLPATGHLKWPAISLLAGLFVLLVISFFALQQSYNRMAISVRRSWSLVLSFFLIAVPAALLSPPLPGYAHWLLLSPAFALLVALPLYAEINRKLGILLFWFLIVLLTFAQLSPLY